MTDTTQGVVPEGGTSAPARPQALTRAQKRLFAALLPATVLMYSVYQATQQVLLPPQVEAIDPANKVANFAVLTTIGSVAAVLALPIGGALSDRTRGRFGRRSPWLVLAGVAGALVTAATGTTANLVILVILFALLQFTMNFYQAVLYAIVPDRVPASRRGSVSAIMGVGIPLGILVGVNLAAQLNQVLGYVVVAALFLLSVFGLVIFARAEPFYGHVRIADDGTAVPTTTIQSQDAGTRRGGAIRALAGLFSGFRSRDFTIAFVSRFVLFIAYFLSQGYLFYMLQDKLGVENIPGGSVAGGVSILASVNTAAWIIVVPFVGMLADKIDRRKLIVGLAGAAMGVALLIPVLVPTFAGFVIYSLCVGIFFGSYMALDISIMSLVLPNPENEGRDLAILAIATSAPQIIGPTLASILILYLGGYDAVFIVSAACALAGGLMTLLIRVVR